jgi:hypothetical protein
MKHFPIVYVSHHQFAIRVFIFRVLVLMWLFAGVSVIPVTAEGSELCDAAAAGFLQFPSASSLKALRKGDAENCWSSIGTSNDKLMLIDASVSNGNVFAARYLASNLKRLDGGNLEDALIALGQFSEKDMSGFLDLSRAHVITSRERSDALTMLPPSMSDDPRAQLAAMERRHEAVTRVSQKPLEEYRLAALSDINKFVIEIQRSMDNKESGTH